MPDRTPPSSGAGVDVEAMRESLASWTDMARVSAEFLHDAGARRLSQHLMNVAIDLERDVPAMLATITRLEAEKAEMAKAVKGACFHYWNCMNECPKAKHAMANLARIGGYSDPAVDDEIARALAPETTDGEKGK